MNENEELKSAYHSGWIDAIGYVIKNELFVEPKTGKWVKTNLPERSDNIICDQCGYNSIAEFIYCPNCGVKMEVTG